MLPDPVVSDLNALDTPGRTSFLLDMTLLGDAILEVTDAARINYSVLGTSDEALHAHVTPRYRGEPETLRRGPPAFYDRKNAPQFDPERDAVLIEKLKEAIVRLSGQAISDLNTSHNQKFNRNLCYKRELAYVLQMTYLQRSGINPKRRAVRAGCSNVEVTTREDKDA